MADRSGSGHSEWLAVVVFFSPLQVFDFSLDSSLIREEGLECCRRHWSAALSKPCGGRTGGLRRPAGFRTGGKQRCRSRLRYDGWMTAHCRVNMYIWKENFFFFFREIVKWNNENRFAMSMNVVWMNNGSSVRPIYLPKKVKININLYFASICLKWIDIIFH